MPKEQDDRDTRGEERQQHRLGHAQDQDESGMLAEVVR